MLTFLSNREGTQATYEFSAEVSVLTHSTTIQPRYQAVIHCEIVRQVRYS